MHITDSHIYFYGGIYSNWYVKSRLLTDPLSGSVFDSTEQAFMWSKAIFFRDLQSAISIALQPDPREVKALGRQIEGYNDKAWNCVRLGYMTYVNYLKFSQNADLGKQLIETANRTLVEASPYDKIWGIGLSVEEAAAGKTWNGQNLLGTALMDVRNMLK